MGKKITEISEIPGVGDALLKKLASIGLTTLQQIAHSNPRKLEETEGIGEETAQKLIIYAREAMGLDEFSTGFEIEQDEQNIVRISTGSKELDNLLTPPSLIGKVHGGLESMLITESHSLFAGGKTQIGFQLAVNVQLPKEQGGLDSGAVFLDSLLHDEPIIIKENDIIKIVRIGEFTDSFFGENEEDSKLLTREILVPVFNGYDVIWKKINRVYRHENKDEKYRVTLKNGLNIGVTSAHSLFRANFINHRKPKINNIEEIQTNLIREKDFLVCPKKIPLDSFDNTLHIFNILKQNNVVGIRSNKDAKKFNIHNGSRGFLREISVDEDFASFMGWYLAEGHTGFRNGKGPGKVVLTLNTKTDVEAAELCKRICAKFNLRYTVYVRSTTWQISITSMALASLFKIIFGTGAKNKRVPSAVFSFGDKLKEAFILAWFKGDGGSSASEMLISDINYLGLFLGRRYCIYRHKPSSKPIFIDGREIKRGFTFAACDSTKRDGLNRHLRIGDLCFIKAKKVEKIHNDKKYVYDLCVDEYHNFVGGYGGIFAHNTESTMKSVRVREIAENRALASGMPKEEAAKAADKVLKNIYVARVASTDHFIKLLQKTEEIVRDGKAKLIIVDSIMAPFRHEYRGRDELPNRQGALNEVLFTLQNMANIYNIPVYVTNQVMATPTGNPYVDPVTPIGGNILAHATCRLYLRKGKDNKRIARLVDSSSLPLGEAIFKITEKGIEDVEE